MGGSQVPALKMGGHLCSQGPRLAPLLWRPGREARARELTVLEDTQAGAGHPCPPSPKYEGAQHHPLFRGRQFLILNLRSNGSHEGIFKTLAVPALHPA